MPRGTSAATQAQEGIINYIRVNRLGPGDILPSETFLCEELGFSRTSVREAIRTLSSLDIVEVRHGHGTYVSNMSLAPMIQGMILRVVLDADKSLATLDHIVDLRSAIDHSLAQELVEIWKDKDTAPLYAIVDEMRTRHANGQPFINEDRAFHRALLSEISNPLITELSDAFWEIHMALMPELELRMPSDIALTIEAHAEMVGALEKADPDLFKSLVDEHYAPLRRTLSSIGGEK